MFDKWLTRYQQALAESRNGTYSTEKWMSDVGAFWGDAASLAAFPLAVIDPATFAGESGAATPTISLTVDGTQDEVVEAFPVADPGAGKKVAASKLVSPNGDAIPDANVEIELSAGRRFLVVRLVGLTALLAGPDVPKGTYTGKVTPVGEQAPEVARINVERK